MTFLRLIGQFEEDNCRRWNPLFKQFKFHFVLQTDFHCMSNCFIIPSLLDGLKALTGKDYEKEPWHLL